MNQQDPQDPEKQKLKTVMPDKPKKIVSSNSIKVQDNLDSKDILENINDNNDNNENKIKLSLSSDVSKKIAITVGKV